MLQKRGASEINTPIAFKKIVLMWENQLSLLSRMTSRYEISCEFMTISEGLILVFIEKEIAFNLDLLIALRIAVR